MSYSFPLLVVLAIVVGFFYLKKTKKWIFAKKASSYKAAIPGQRAKKSKLHIDRDTLLEKSWEFFSKIANRVINQFSPDDQKTLLQIGVALEKAGMQYCHVINYTEIKQSLSPSVSKEQEVRKTR